MKKELIREITEMITKNVFSQVWNNDTGENLSGKSKRGRKI